MICILLRVNIAYNGRVYTACAPLIYISKIVKTAKITIDQRGTASYKDKIPHAVLIESTFYDGTIFTVKSYYPIRKLLSICSIHGVCALNGEYSS